MKEIYTLLREQPGIGEYYGFHGAASSSVLPQVKYHHDQRFVSPGPGAVYTIKLLWPDAPKKLYDELPHAGGHPLGYLTCVGGCPSRSSQLS